MPLTEKEVRHIAELAHLDLTDEEVKKFQPQLDAILEYVQKLSRLDTSDVEPMARVLDPGSANPSLRADEVRQSLPQNAALANAPEPGEGFFKVPSVIERE